ncbi:MAG: hypothetical protein M3Y87_24490 [Myxococcota bacterium]|nr:hypothetical protein [Myxococcota bacterium]
MLAGVVGSAAGDVLVLAYRDASGFVRTRTGTWMTDGVTMDWGTSPASVLSSGVAVSMAMAADASPGLAGTSGAFYGNRAVLVVTTLSTAGDPQLHLYSSPIPLTSWTDHGVIPNSGLYGVRSRPSIEFVPSASGDRLVVAVLGSVSVDTEEDYYFSTVLYRSRPNSWGGTYGWMNLREFFPDVTSTPPAVAFDSRNPLCQRRMRQLPLDISVAMGGEWDPDDAEAVPCSWS